VIFWRMSAVRPVEKRSMICSLVIRKYSRSSSFFLLLSSSCLFSSQIFAAVITFTFWSFPPNREPEYTLIAGVTSLLLGLKLRAGMVGVKVQACGRGGGARWTSEQLRNTKFRPWPLRYRAQCCATRCHLLRLDRNYRWHC
jgi:hypothetical protein